MRLLIFGFGYAAQRLAIRHRSAFTAVMGTVRSARKADILRGQGLEALVWPPTSSALETALAKADAVLVSVPPDENGDPVLAALGPAIATGRNLRWIGYWSTVAVYGDQAGAWIDETSPARPGSARGRARLVAEEGWARVAAACGAALHILRLPGIYGPGRSAIDQLREGTARRLSKPGQVFNRVHVDDIAGATVTAMTAHARLPGRHVFNITDDEPAPAEEVVAHAARLMGIEPPPLQDFLTADLSPMARSFYAENKRVSNRRMHDTLGYSPLYPDYREGLAAILADSQAP